MTIILDHWFRIRLSIFTRHESGSCDVERVPCQRQVIVKRLGIFINCNGQLLI